MPGLDKIATFHELISFDLEIVKGRERQLLKGQTCHEVFQTSDISQQKPTYMRPKARLAWMKPEPLQKKWCFFIYERF